MSDKLEGTFELDGLLQGKVLDAEELLARMRGWAEFCRTQSGLKFSVDVHGDIFEVLPDNRPMDVPTNRPPSDVVQAALEDLLSGLTPPQRAGVQSTIRSSEYRPGQEVQTLYVAQQDGTIKADQRTVKAQTTARPQPLTLRQKLIAGGAALAIVAAILAIGALFLPYGEWFGRLTGRGGYLDAERTRLDPGPFAQYMTLENLRPMRGGGAGQVTLKRTPKFPLTDEKLGELLTALPPAALRDRLAVESIARGYLRVELVDESGKVINWFWLNIADLRGRDSMEVQINASEAKTAIHRLRFAL